MKAAVKLNPLASWGMAFALALGLAACGGSSNNTPEKSAADMAADMAKECRDDGGRVEADGSCTPAETVAMEGRAKTQRMTLSDTVKKARDAVGMVDNESTDAEVMAADDAMAALKKAIADAVDLPKDDADVAEAQGTYDTLTGTLASAKTDRTKAMGDAQDMADKAMMATALKLYRGIGPTPIGGTGDDVRTVASDAAGVISVTKGSVTTALAEDKKTMVAELHGWKGKRHTAEPTGSPGTYEAMVYSDEMPMEGDPFNEEYTLATTATATVLVGEITIDQSDTTAHPTSRVASPSFDQSAGVKEFERGTNQQRVPIPGTYHGVSGTFYCTPAANSACAAQKAPEGFTLGGTADTGNAFTAAGGTWAFKPSNAEAMVTDAADTIYASYGWWLHKSEDGNTYTASAFATARGTVAAAAGIGTLRGTAKYTGGAVGKYALHSSTGGINDAGHFTAKATLDADFDTDMITGTINEFMVGADGESRNWSVELMKQGVGDTGIILGDDGTGTAKMTKWTIDGEAAAAAGQWRGTLYDNGADSVPKVGTGTFSSEHSTSGRMVGAFGVNKQ